MRTARATCGAGCRLSGIIDSGCGLCDSPAQSLSPESPMTRHHRVMVSQTVAQTQPQGPGGSGRNWPLPGQSTEELAPGPCSSDRSPRPQSPTARWRRAHSDSGNRRGPRATRRWHLVVIGSPPTETPESRLGRTSAPHSATQWSLSGGSEIKWRILSEINSEKFARHAQCARLAPKAPAANRAIMRFSRAARSTSRASARCQRFCGRH
jgi:hypothetical protein